VSRRATLEEQADRLSTIEQALVRRMSAIAVARHYARAWGMTERGVRKYIQRVREAWAAEALAEAAAGRSSRESARDAMRASVNAVFAKAMTRSEIVRDGSGNPVLEPKTGRPLTREVPDLRSAASAARILIDLDGLSNPPPQHVIHQGTVGQHVTVSTAGRDELERFLAGLPKPPEEPEALPAQVAGNGANGAKPGNGADRPAPGVLGGWRGEDE
jgi:predicted transcriptional regulator